jgi:hypothetical protein
MHRIFTMSVADVYPHYVTKVERKGRTKDELDEVIGWLTGFDGATLQAHLSSGTTFETFFAEASMNPNASMITGVVCGVRVESIEDPLMQKIRYLDKLVDELAQGQADDQDPARLTSDPGEQPYRRSGTAALRFSARCVPLRGTERAEETDRAEFTE